MTQFEKMMLAIRTEKFLSQMYDEIDKSSAKGLESLVFELQGEHTLDLAINIANSFARNTNILSCDVECIEGVYHLFVAWENK